MKDYLRDGTVALPADLYSTQQLYKEASFYAIQGLTDLCLEKMESALPANAASEPTCQVPMITSLQEEQALIGQSSRPVVKLLYNRGNNKYSYTRWFKLTCDFKSSRILVNINNLIVKCFFSVIPMITCSKISNFLINSRYDSTTGSYF